MKVSIYKDSRKTKPWVVRWYGMSDMTTGKRKRYCKSFEIKTDADRFRLETELKFLNGGPLDRTDGITLRQFFDRWLNVKRCNANPETIRDYKQIVNRLIDYFGAEYPLQQINPQAAHQFVAELQPQRTMIEKLSPATRKTYITYCKTIFNTAVEWDLIDRSPFKTVRKQKDTESEWYYLNVDEYKALLEAVPSLRWQVIYTLAYTCGLRKAEILNLQHQDIDSEQRILTIRNHSATNTTPPFTTKNGKSRQVPIPEHTLAILQKYHLQQGRIIPYVALTIRQYENLVIRWQSYQRQRRPWGTKSMSFNINREFNRHIKKAKIKPTAKLTLHTLRKCAGKNWADRIPNAKVVQELMGHQDIATTMRYYNKVNNDDLNKAASAIGDLLRKSDAKVTPNAAIS